MTVKMQDDSKKEMNPILGIFLVCLWFASVATFAITGLALIFSSPHGPGWVKGIGGLFMFALGVCVFIGSIAYMAEEYG